MPICAVKLRQLLTEAVYSATCTLGMPLARHLPMQRESSLHDGSTAAAALAAGLYGDVEGKPALEAISPFAQISRV